MSTNTRRREPKPDDTRRHPADTVALVVSLPGFEPVRKTFRSPHNMTEDIRFATDTMSVANGSKHYAVTLYKASDIMLEPLTESKIVVHYRGRMWTLINNFGVLNRYGEEQLIASSLGNFTDPDLMDDGPRIDTDMKQEDVMKALNFQMDGVSSFDHFMNGQFRAITVLRKTPRWEFRLSLDSPDYPGGWPDLLNELTQE